MAALYYTALEKHQHSISFIYTALTIYPCQIRVLSINADSHTLQLPTARKKEWCRPQRTVYPRRLPVNCETLR